MTGKTIITGTTCTGKTTLGKKLADKFSIVQVDLDEYHFLPNWVEKEKSQFKKDVFSALEKHENWIVSGNYNSIFKDTLFRQADRIIWLDYNLGVILRRYCVRTFRRVVYKEKCCGDNYETLGRTFSSDSLFLWIFKSYWRRKQRMKQWKANDFSDKEWIVFQNPRQTRRFLTEL